MKNKLKFKIGQLIQVINEYRSCYQKIGKIIDIDSRINLQYLVEFFEKVPYGNDGGSLGDNKIKGKEGHCRWFWKEDLKLYNPILKIFLAQKRKEYERK